jgi:phosphoribosylformylglycinamidine cyclo-ligase
VYSGSKKLTDTLIIDNQEITVGKLILSPTRTYLPLLKKILETTEGSDIHGIIHNTGGGQTKVLKFVKDVHIVKNNLFDVPPLFKMIQAESQTEWREMYQVFNMGHRLEVYCTQNAVENLVNTAKNLNIDAQIVGYVKNTEGGEQLTIESPYGIFHY